MQMLRLGVEGEISRCSSGMRSGCRIRVEDHEMRCAAFALRWRNECNIVLAISAVLLDKMDDMNC